jgi:Holliday junction resolvasome RuvABC endonuclease subunit
MTALRVLSLDIATSTGFAIGAHDDARPVTGTVRCAAIGDNYGRAGNELFAWLDDIIRVHRPDVVAYEAPLIIGGRTGTTRPTNAGTVRLLFGLVMAVEMATDRHGLRTYECHIQTVRRHFTGNGRCQKSEVMARCRTLGWDVGSNDAADAAAIWDYARSVLRPGTAVRTTPMFQERRA